MTLNEPLNCPRCGSPLTAGGGEELCAACLLLQAMEPGIQTETEIGSPGESSSRSGRKSPSEFRELPCDFGGYRLLRLLGRGGMGAVYEAEQISTGRRIALKMLSQQFDSAVMRARFLREGRLAAGISHPNSLYVFGAEEINGIPVITMEIAHSGTLADQLKKRGPLPVADAVDVVLGLITGLEAAHAAGVLHRDVKPSNVFVGSDGSVKVGDYGLSVSTIATVDSFATATGVALGTPAYSAPEQLRGDELDVRADIYSVGATLFNLLTDRAPIEGKNAVQIVAAALDEKPKSLSELRRDIPPDLAHVVSRCLAKKPEQRYADYVELRKALLPFSSESLQPAPPAKRAFAYAVDEMLSWFIPGLAVATYYGVGSLSELPLQQQLWPGLMLALWYIAYYALPEGRWGAGPGKGLAGIRVVRTNGRSPGNVLALLRAVIACFVRQGGTIFLLTGIGVGFWGASFLANAALYFGFSWGAILVPVVTMTLYFGFSWGLMLAPLVTMRRRNGYAIAWDLVTQTRVVENPEHVARPLIDGKTLADGQTKEPVDGSEVMGPYAVVGPIAPGWIAAFDPALHRRVWLRQRNTTPLDESRRNLARPGRSRWLQSIETPDTTWDVFEALPGVSLSGLCRREPTAHAAVSQPSRPETRANGTGRKRALLHWEAVRHWLYELTIELAQASDDATLPKQLSLDHVWITATGRAMLLDEAWPAKSPSFQDALTPMLGEGAPAKPQPAATASDLSDPRKGDEAEPQVDLEFEHFDVGDIAGQLSFIDAIARCADPTTIPLYARPVLKNLAAGSFEKLSFLAGNFRSLLNKPTRIDRTVRAASLLALPLILIAFIVLSAFVTTPVLTRARAAELRAAYPNLPALIDVLRFRESLTSGDARQQYVDIHLAGHYGYADFSDFFDYQRYRLLSDHERNILRRAIDPPPEYTPGQLLEADRQLNEALPEFLQKERQSNLSTAVRGVVASSLGIVFLVALIQLLSLTLLATTAGQHLFGFAVVTEKGEPAGRVRLISRWLIAWSPLFLALPVSIVGIGGLPVLLLFQLLVFPWFVGLAVAVIRPSRGVQDQLAGCWLVPR